MRPEDLYPTDFNANPSTGKLKAGTKEVKDRCLMSHLIIADASELIKKVEELLEEPAVVRRR